MPSYANLITYPALVEAPFVVLKVGDYTFGMVDKSGSLKGGLKVDYPNYMQSIEIVKTNGTINTYTIQMVYVVTENDDPNKLDKIFASISDTRKVYISYGDWASPQYVFKEEEALLTQLTCNADFKSSKISYTLSCTSSCALLAATAFDFPKTTKKVSDIIKNILYNESYGLLNVFTGMQNRSKVEKMNLIPGDDAVVTVESQDNTNPLSYLQHLANSITSMNDVGNKGIKSTSYALTVSDDTSNELGGPYFKISAVQTGAATQGTASVQTNNTTNPLVPEITQSDVGTFELNIGYPDNTFITDFTLESDDSWAILYNYAEETNVRKWNYRLDDNGHLITTEGPNLLLAGDKRRITAENSSWWTKMTQFPISATVVIRGLIRPAILMSYVRVNTYFFGHKHISSGLYIITKQTDSVNASGYKTTLRLTRVGGDTDTISIGGGSHGGSHSF